MDKCLFQLESWRGLSFLGRHAKKCVLFDLYNTQQNLASVARWRIWHGWRWPEYGTRAGLTCTDDHVEGV